MRAWFALGIAVALAVISLAAFAGDAPPKRHLSWWDAMVLWQGPPKQEQVQKQEEPKQEKPKLNWGWLKKQKPPCGCYAGGEAVNYPPYDVEP